MTTPVVSLSLVIPAYNEENRNRMPRGLFAIRFGSGNV
jgi:hypothetical protein